MDISFLQLPSHIEEVNVISLDKQSTWKATKRRREGQLISKFYGNIYLNYNKRLYCKAYYLLIVTIDFYSIPSLDHRVYDGWQEPGKEEQVKQEPSLHALVQYSLVNHHHPQHTIN